MNNRTEKKRRRFMRENFLKKINEDANRFSGSAIFRLARQRDILGVLLIAASCVIITLSILLFIHW